MALTFTQVASEATITTSERSLPADTTSGVPTSQTTWCRLQFILDLTAVIAGDDFRCIVYEKVDNGTQRVLETFEFVGVQPGLFVSPVLWLSEGWDITLKKIAGTDRSIRWSIKEDIGDVNVVQWRGDTPATLGVSGEVNAGLVSSGTGVINTSNHPDILPFIYYGQVVASTSTTITLTTFVSPMHGSPDNTTNDLIVGCTIDIYDGTGGAGNGAGQTRTIKSYNGTTKVATVDRAWTTNPTTSARYRIYGALQVLGSWVAAGSEPDVNVSMWQRTAVATPSTAGVPKIEVDRWLGTSQPSALVSGKVDVNVSKWDSTNIASVTNSGVPRVDIYQMTDQIGGGVIRAAPLLQIVAGVWNALTATYVAAGSMGLAQGSSSAPTTTQIRDALLDYEYRTGRTVRGLFRRLGAAIEGKATGLLGTLATFFQPDGATTEFSAAQSPTAGTRSTATVTNSEVP